MKKDGGLSFLVPRRHWVYFLENYLFSGRFSCPEKGLSEQVLGDLCPLSPQSLPGMGDGGLGHTQGEEGTAEKGCGFSEMESVSPGALA